MAIPLVTLILLVVAAVGSYQLGLLNDAICDGPCSAEFVEPPEEIADPVAAAAFAPAAASAGPADAAKVDRAVRSALTQANLGGRTGFVALDAETGTQLAAFGSGALIPASTTKVVTSFAALAAIDADMRFATRVVATTPSELVLVGGGDPFLMLTKPKRALYAHPATLADLAKRTAAALKAAGTSSVTLSFDDSLFSGPDDNPKWERSYVAGNIVTPISALWADRGIVNGLRSRNPAQDATASFGTLLEKGGITVKLAGRTTASDAAEEIARVEGGTVRQILEYINLVSDNEAAEVMLRQIAIARGKPGTFEAGAEEMRALLGAADIDTTGLVLYDGSGLSRHNRISPLTLAETVRTASLDPKTASLVPDLPVGGFSGSTLNRFQGSAAKAGNGVVRAKTGTLTGVHSLAGIVRDADGHLIVFAAMTDDTKSVAPVATQAALDNVIAALAACRCGS